MNIVFICGKIVSNIEFKFMIDKKHISIVTFSVELSNKSIVRVMAYDEMADKCYKELEKGNKVAITGKLESKGVLLSDLHRE